MLPLIDRKNAAPNDLGGEGRLVEAETDNGDRKGAEGLNGVELNPQNIGEGHTKIDGGVEIAEIVEHQQQHDQRDRAQKPDIAPREAREQRRLGHAGKGQKAAQDEADNG